MEVESLWLWKPWYGCQNMTFWDITFLNKNHQKTCSVYLKVRSLIFKILFSTSMYHHPKDVNLKVSVETINLIGRTKQFAYCSCLYLTVLAYLWLTITSHIFINIFQREHFWAVKFAIGYEKNMSFLVIPKSSKIWIKVEQIGLGFFNGSWTLGFHVVKSYIKRTVY